jgi:hypothetical protein
MPLGLKITTKHGIILHGNASTAAVESDSKDSNKERLTMMGRSFQRNEATQ